MSARSKVWTEEQSRKNTTTDAIRVELTMLEQDEGMKSRNGYEVKKSDSAYLVTPESL